MSDSHPSVARLAAPLLLSGLWNWCLYGVLVVQCHAYSRGFSEDKLTFKLLVSTIFFIETVQTVLNSSDMYFWFVSGSRNTDHLSFFVTSFFGVPIVEAVVSLIVQFFYVYRIWLLSAKKSRWLCLSICLLSFTGAAGAFAGGIYVSADPFHACLYSDSLVQTQVNKKKFSHGRRFQDLALTWLTGNTLADALIASAVLHDLTKGRRDTNDASVDNTLVGIVRLTMETNVVTTSVGIVAFLMIVLFPDENWYTCPMAILGRLYSNTLLVWLNNRISVRNAADSVVPSSRPAPIAITRRVECSTSVDATPLRVESPPAAKHKFSGSGELIRGFFTSIASVKSGVSP
ncbi:hypothetical protein BC826DRAFT_1178440 [Russula brevipes]|nr:hypothetical protein BC826DRAFT_1178440 [Russula brevipes]